MSMRLGMMVSIVWLALGVSPARTAEIDSLTHRDQALEDSSKALERRLDDALEAGIAHANRASDRCDEEALYDGLQRAFARPFIGHTLAESLNEDETLDRRRIRRVDSIYRDLGLLDNISVHWKDLSAVVRVGDALVGVDKFGHFVVEGWGYFETAYRDGDGVEAAMTWGEGTEETYFGRYTTGVHSYADLVANFEGMRFWRRVRGGGVDPLEDDLGRKRPYVQCKRRFRIFGERKWRASGKLELDDYVTPVWDEAVNCSRYRNDEIEARVEARVAELSEATGVDLACPIDPRACAKARRRYGAWAPRLLHPACFAADPPASRWWPLW